MMILIIRALEPIYIHSSIILCTHGVVAEWPHFKGLNVDINIQ